MNFCPSLQPINTVFMEKQKVVGLMSGTSLDGLDLAYCEFEKIGEKWNFNIVFAETIKYDSSTKLQLNNLANLSAFEFCSADRFLGNLFGTHVRNFIEKNKIHPDFVSSHGHTVFHQPEKGLTVQIGNGANISAQCSLPVICDFRTLDVALEGQGAPLVPIGDALLFNEYDLCLNIGGIANASFNYQNKRVAYDICLANIPLNSLALSNDKDFDENGELARSGNLNANLLSQLNELDFYLLPFPKSLGKEWYDEIFAPELSKAGLNSIDLLRTVTEHIAMQISSAIEKAKTKTVLITGGGALNKFLIERIQNLSSAQIIIPDNKIVEFKEALIFAFLGVLRLRQEPNCLSSVTGSLKDNVGGAIYFNK